MRIRSIVLLVLVGLSADVIAQAPESMLVFEGKPSNDPRLGELKTLDGHFPFVVPATPGEWDVRAEQLRRRVLVATGLWPMPEKTPLQPVIHGKVERDGFTVERVFFESLPGHFVTGLLFRPDGPSTTPRPAVLSPHGHGGRLQKHSGAALAKELASGGEHFEGSGSMPKIAHCAQLARMGCVTFIFDMLGYADSIQIPQSVAHRHQHSRPEERESDRNADWCFFSPEADLRLQSIMGLQTWNAIRALDFLASLPDVDPDRLACTGGSGGGTQTILLGAIDPRIKVSFPNGMVSTSMQGGCYCENCNLLRVGTGNVELAALFAPRPQAMTAADDWTREMMTDGYPQLRKLYGMLGNEAGVYCRPLLNFGHNYNYVTRATMYQWMNRHLELGLDDPVVEQDFKPLSDEEMLVWDARHPAPSIVGVEHERSVCRWLDTQATAKMAESDFDHTYGAAWRVLLDSELPNSDEISVEDRGSTGIGEITVQRRLVRSQSDGRELPVLVVSKNGTSKTTIVWTLGNGKAAAFNESGRPGKTLEGLLDGGATVVLPDLLGQGEMPLAGQQEGKQRLIADTRAYSAFTFGYNPSLVSARTGDLLLTISFAKTLSDSKIALLSTNQSAPWAAAAGAVAGAVISKAAIETDGFRFADVRSYSDASYVPGAVKYGDLPALLALRSPAATRLYGEQGETDPLVRSQYESKSADTAIQSEVAARFDQSGIDWLVGEN